MQVGATFLFGGFFQFLFRLVHLDSHCGKNALFGHTFIFFMRLLDFRHGLGGQRRIQRIAMRYRPYPAQHGYEEGKLSYFAGDASQHPVAINACHKLRGGLYGEIQDKANGNLCYRRFPRDAQLFGLYQQDPQQGSVGQKDGAFNGNWDFISGPFMSGGHHYRESHCGGNAQHRPETKFGHGAARKRLKWV